MKNSSRYVFCFLSFLFGVLVTIMAVFVLPEGKRQYGVYILKLDKTFCLNNQSSTCFVLPKGSRIYSEELEGPSHDLNNILIVPLLMADEEISGDFLRDGSVEWPPPPYVLEQNIE